MTDTGFNPAAVSIPVGGSVTWKNTGSITHNATSVGGAPSTFNTGGVGPGESVTLVFPAAGSYFYTSGTDCLYNASSPGFPCSVSYLVTVGTPASPSPSEGPAAVPQAAPGPPVASAAVTISDSGFSPPAVSVGLNGTVTWTNHGANVHTATSTPDTNNSLPPFDSGGLGPGQASSITFSAPGTYVYFSAPDCFSKSNPPGFNCAYYTVVVASTPASAPGAQPAAPAVPSVTVPGATVGVAIDDRAGFQPDMVVIKAGQSVGWLNTGSVAHSVVINQNATPDQPAPWWLPYKLPTNNAVFFDSGGIGPQQSFTFAFPTPGTYPYHSSTEPVYLQNYTNCSCTFTTYQFFGTVVVQP